MRLRRCRPLALSLLVVHLGACATWQPSTVSPRQLIEEERPPSIRVIRHDGTELGPARALLRAAIFLVLFGLGMALSYGLPNLLIALGLAPAMFAVPQGRFAFAFLNSVGVWLLAPLVPFVTARRHNGWTAAHDLLSRSRVVARV